MNRGLLRSKYTRTANRSILTCGIWDSADALALSVDSTTHARWLPMLSEAFAMHPQSHNKMPVGSSSCVNLGTGANTTESDAVLLASQVREGEQGAFQGGGFCRRAAPEGSRRSWRCVSGLCLTLAAIQYQRTLASAFYAARPLHRLALRRVQKRSARDVQGIKSAGCARKMSQHIILCQTCRNG